MSVALDVTVDALMRADAAAIPVLIRHRLRCPGCPAAAFHTLAEACRAHGVAPDPVFADLAAAIGLPPPPA